MFISTRFYEFAILYQRILYWCEWNMEKIEKMSMDMCGVHWVARASTTMHKLRAHPRKPAEASPVPSSTHLIISAPVFLKCVLYLAWIILTTASCRPRLKSERSERCSQNYNWVAFGQGIVANWLKLWHNPGLAQSQFATSHRYQAIIPWYRIRKPQCKKGSHQEGKENQTWSAQGKGPVSVWFIHSIFRNIVVKSLLVYKD